MAASMSEFSTNDEVVEAAELAKTLFPYDIFEKVVRSFSFKSCVRITMSPLGGLF